MDGIDGPAGSDGIEFAFVGEVVTWRGPAPYHFVPLPPAEAALVRDLAPLLTYGWGAIPARARIGGTAFTTSLMPRDGGYLLPVKDAVRVAEGIAPGDPVSVELVLGR